LKILNNNVILKGDTLYIYIKERNTIELKELYIFLENILSAFFYDIYKQDIENKTVSKTKYKTALSKMLDESGTRYIIILDKLDNIDYYFDLDNQDFKSQFIDEILKTIF
jgi:Cdc6-like AAA superfamily ATPase